MTIYGGNMVRENSCNLFSQNNPENYYIKIIHSRTRKKPKLNGIFVKITQSSAVSASHWVEVCLIFNCNFSQASLSAANYRGWLYPGNIYASQSVMCHHEHLRVFSHKRRHQIEPRRSNGALKRTFVAKNFLWINRKNSERRLYGSSFPYYSLYCSSIFALKHIKISIPTIYRNMCVLNSVPFLREIQQSGLDFTKVLVLNFAHLS